MLARNSKRKISKQNKGETTVPKECGKGKEEQHTYGKGKKRYEERQVEEPSGTLRSVLCSRRRDKRRKHTRRERPAL